jgi:hypothetical protein
MDLKGTGFTGLQVALVRCRSHDVAFSWRRYNKIVRQLTYELHLVIYARLQTWRRAMRAYLTGLILLFLAASAVSTLSLLSMSNTAGFNPVVSYRADTLER